MQYGVKCSLDKNSKIIIYGAATTGAVLYHNLCENGYKIIAFVDKRADEIDSYYNLPVWNFEEAEKHFENDDLVAVIGIKNVFEHERIAGMLWEMKCTKIIFRPYNELEGTGNIKERELNRLYNEALRGYLTYCYTIEDVEDTILKDHAVLSEDDEYVIANIPTHYVFTDNYQDKKIMWGDIPCLGLIPHIGLFNLFLGKNNQDYKEYISFCREAAIRSGGIVTSKAWEDSVYTNRLDVFNHMQYAWEHDRSFFIKNAVEAKYNNKGYFNIISGKHRVVYLLVKGNRYIPLKIKKSEYYQWRDGKNLGSRIKKLLEKADRDSLPVIIGNPYYYNYRCDASDFYKVILDKLIWLIFKERYKKKAKFNFEGATILFYNTPLAFYADVFLMLGFDVFVFEQDNEHKMLIDMLTEGKCHYVEGIDHDVYTWSVIQGENVNISIKTEKTIYISREEKEQVLASGLVNGEFIFAFLNPISMI